MIFWLSRNLLIYFFHHGDDGIFILTWPSGFMISCLICFNSLMPGDTYYKHKSTGSLVQIMAWHLINAKPLTEPMLTYLSIRSLVSNLKSASKYAIFVLRKKIRLKSCLADFFRPQWVKYKCIWEYANQISGAWRCIWVIGHVTLVAIIRNTILVPYPWVKSLWHIWRSGNRRFHLRVPDLQMSCRDLTTVKPVLRDHWILWSLETGGLWQQWG